LFIQLKNFYNQSRDLQYFVNLITVPTLPNTPPNFLVQSDLGNYTAPVVVIPDQEPDQVSVMSESLIDTSAPPTPVLPPRTRSNPTPPPLPPAIDHDKLLQERDDLIKHLQTEIQRQS
jgi:huntingtin interacting protein 1